MYEKVKRVLKEIYYSFIDELFNGGYYELKIRLGTHINERNKEFSDDIKPHIWSPKTIKNLKKIAELDRKRLEQNL